MREEAVAWRVDLMFLTGTPSSNVDNDFGLLDKNVYTLYEAIEKICRITMDRFHMHWRRVLCK
jgi:hypothetical protein